MKELEGRDLTQDLPEGYSIQQLTGDASTRSYFRIFVPDGKTIVLMRMPAPFDERNFPYLENYHLFRSSGIPVAEIYWTDPARGYVFLEDLGDKTFFELYEAWPAQTRLSYFLKAIDLLPVIERIHPRSTLAFDTEKLSWELTFFLEHLLMGLRQVPITANERAEYSHWFQRLASELAERPRVFCHRDYHSRNLMVNQQEVYVIDFQDARFGPSTYDLASLCYDSYIQHSSETIRYLENLFFIRHPDPQIQRHEYPRMCLQRNLKALGTFGYQASVLARKFYLPFIGPTLDYVRRHLDELPEYSEFGKLLARHLPELGS